MSSTLPGLPARVLQSWLKRRVHPLAAALDVDSPDAVSVHQKIVHGNPLLQEVYRAWYSELLPSVEATAKLAPRPMVELGCGASHLEKYIPGVIKTDCVATINTDAVVDAQALPYGDSSLRAVFMTSLLHHLPDPEKCLREVERCLAPGGRLALVEPSNSRLQERLINLFSAYESHDDQVADWAGQPTGRLTNANTALAWVIFVRDRARFERTFAGLQFVEIRYHTVLAGAVSGGMSFRPFLPAWTRPLVRAFEFVTGPVHRWLGTLMTVVLEKRG